MPKKKVTFFLKKFDINKKSVTFIVLEVTNTTTKKTMMKKVNNIFRSKVMKAAWTIFKKGGKSFSEALKSAWNWAKKNLTGERTIEVVGEIIRETAKAVLIETHSFGHSFLCKVWMPKSAIVSSDYATDSHQVKSWFVEKKRNERSF